MTIRQIIYAAVVLFMPLPLFAATYSYDEAGRLVVTTYDDGSQIIYEYDAAGNRTEVERSATTVAVDQMHAGPFSCLKPS